MKYCHSFLFSIFLLMASTVAPAQSRSQVESLSKSIEADLVESILPFWSKYTVDPDGGFYGTVMDDGRAVASDKGAILNARILWTCSRALVQVTNSGSNSESQCLPVVDGKVEVFMPAESFVSVFAE